MRFVRKGREYAIEGRLPSGDVKFRDALTGASFAAPDGELVEEPFDGNVELLGEDRCRQTLKDKLAKARVADISQLADDDPLKIEIVRRFNYVKELIGAQPLARTGKNLIPLVQRVSARIGDPRPPSCTTLNRWFRAYD